MAKQIEMSLSEVKAGLGQMERWAKMLQDAIENYDEGTGKAVLRRSQKQDILRKKTTCPPPETAV